LEIPSEFKMDVSVKLKIPTLIEAEAQIKPAVEVNRTFISICS